MKKPSFFQRLCKKNPSENGYIEIHNLFAKYQDTITVITAAQVEELDKKYKFQIAKKFKKERLALFETYVDHCLIQKKLKNQDIDTLNHIRAILQLNHSDTDELLVKKSLAVFESEVSRFLSMRVCTDETKTYLFEFSTGLQLPLSVAQDGFASVAKKAVDTYLNPILEGERISPEEKVAFYKFAESVGGVVDDELRRTLERYEKYWQIEHGDIPTITPDINLQKSENLYFTTLIDWMEYRKVSKGVNYAGPTARIKIAKGVYYRMGSLKTRPISEDILQVIDSGELYLTNKRLIFVGERGNKTIGIHKILTINPYSNGVDIQKDTGKSPFFQFSTDVQMFSLILIMLNIITLILRSHQSVATKYNQAFYLFELISVVVFSFEYFLRLWTADIKFSHLGKYQSRKKEFFSFLGIVDLFAILPFYIPMIIPFDLRILRISRMFRIFKLNRYSNALGVIKKICVEKKDIFLITLYIMAIILLISSVLLYYAEYDAQPEKFSSITATLWWSFETLTTVGYGDIYPITTLGKILAGIIGVLGIGVVALPAGIISSGFIEALSNKKQSVPCCPHCGKNLHKD